MRQAVILSILLVATSVLSFGQVTNKAQGRSEAVQEVKLALRQIEEASLRVDRASLEGLLAEDFTFTNSVGVASTKRQHIEAFGPGRFELVSVSIDEEDVRVYGDTAVVTRSGERKAQVGGRDVSGRVRSLMVFVRRGGRWQLVAQQDTRVMQAPPR